MGKENYNLIHHKDFHKLQLQNYNVKERAIFLTLCLKLMEQEDDVVSLKISELTKISNYSPRKKGDNIILFLKELNDKLKTMEIIQTKENGDFKSITLFPTFEVNQDFGEVKIRVNPDYKYLLNHLQPPFTIQDVVEYSGLKSGYSQLMYSILKNWNKAKKISFKLDDFKKEMGIPENYRICDIDSRVIAPITSELSILFHGLKVEKIKNGRSVAGFEFTWKDNKVDDVVVDEEEIEISEELLSAIEKAEKNRFIKSFLTDDNIIKLLDKFSQEQLEKGLKAAYDLIKTEFTSLNYLVKVIEDNINKPKRKIVIRRTKEAEKIKEVEEPVVKKKTTPLTNEEYQNAIKIYQATGEDFGYEPEEVREYIKKYKDLI